ncbi:MAG: DUF1524 domain-containing protein [Proteobacteria bacterium]|nr:DUF1524 domain-containing protein [Pseudomonadota bacterium]
MTDDLEVLLLNRHLRFPAAAFLVLLSGHTFAQLPTFPTSSRLLQIPVLEAQIDDVLSYYAIALQASEDFSAFSLASAVELDLLTYDRDDWKHWEDFDKDCQNTRHELLISSSEVAVTFTSSTGCTVSTGQWLDPYTGGTYTLASDLDIDHVIPLNYAHLHGGAVWSPFVKKLFANDPENLLAVDDGENQSKSAKGPSEWMPPDVNYHCEYVRKWDFLANKYELVLSAEDLDRVKAVLAGCL